MQGIFFLTANLMFSSHCKGDERHNGLQNHVILHSSRQAPVRGKIRVSHARAFLHETRVFWLGLWWAACPRAKVDFVAFIGHAAVFGTVIPRPSLTSERRDPQRPRALRGHRFPFSYPPVPRHALCQRPRFQVLTLILSLASKSNQN